MPSALIFGGSGKVAKHLTRLLSSQSPPWTIYSIIRNADHTPDLKALGPHVEPLVQSIEDSSVSDIASTLRSHKPDIVVWAAGAGGKGGQDRTDKVDREGAIKSFDACAEAGVKRYIMVSANDVRDRERKLVPEWYEEDDIKVSDKSWGAIPHYFKAKLAADRDLVSNNGRRGLEYTIVRPSTLSEEPGKGTVKAGRVRLGQQISREDVAATIMECIKNEGTVGLAFDLLGGDVPIKEAVKRVADERVDCFEGYY
jgi:nucleoside-diphosphate-sugar epimerase